MIFKGNAFIFWLLVVGFQFSQLCICLADQPKPGELSDQQISEFSLAGYGEKGKKTWDLAGKTADIFTDVVRLKKVIGNLYGKEEDIKLTAENGDFNKDNGKIHLQENVVITTSTGTKLTTDSLDWDRKGQIVSTLDRVNIERQNMVIVAQGARGEPNLKQVALNKDVRLDINPDDPAQGQKGGTKEKIVVTCDGPLEINYAANVAIFNKNVKVERTDSTIYSDTMEIYFSSKNDGKKVEPQAVPEAGSQKSPAFMGSSIDKIIARGNVKVVRGENISYSEEAIYSALDKKLTLSGRPKLVIYSSKDMGGFIDASSGN